MGDYEDAYPYDSSKSEVTYKTPKYESLPPTELLALVILLIIVGIAIFSSKKIFKKPDHLQ